MLNLNYTEVMLLTNEEKSEEVCNLLYTMNISGLYIEDYHDLPKLSDIKMWGLIDE